MRIEIQDFTKRKHVYTNVKDASVHDMNTYIIVKFTDAEGHFHMIEIEPINEYLKIDLDVPKRR